MKKKRWRLLAVLGLFCIWTPMRFTGCLLLCASGGALLWDWLERCARAARTARRMIVVLMMTGLMVFTALEARILSYGRTNTEREVQAVVVLGAGVNGVEPSLSLQVRLEAALAYLTDKPELPIVVTGSQGPNEQISEARCMADWLIEHGVAPGRILLEEDADNTEENIRYSRELLAAHGLENVDIAVVTADYHLYRASVYWGDDGIVPVAAHMPAAYWPLTVNYYIREAFAAAKALTLDRFNQGERE